MLQKTKTTPENDHFELQSHEGFGFYSICLFNCWVIFFGEPAVNMFRYDGIRRRGRGRGRVFG